MLKPSPSLGPMYVKRGRTPNYTYWYERAEQLLGRLVDYQFVTQADADQLGPHKLEWKDGIVIQPSQ